MKRVFIIHGWMGSPSRDWYPWLKKELEAKGFEVHVPLMPDPDFPRVKPWISTIKKQVGKLDENTFLVGHSIGCQAVLRYLESLTGKEKCGGAILVAGFAELTEESYEDEEDRKIAKLWLGPSIDWKKIKSHCKNFVSIFSDSDPYVPIMNSEIFKKNLDSKIIIEHKKGHFNVERARKSEEFNITELPSALNSLLEISK